MEGKELVNIIAILTWSICFIGAAIYIGWKLLEDNVGDCVLYAFVIATLLFMATTMDIKETLL